MEFKTNIVQWNSPKYQKYSLFHRRLDSFTINGWPPGLSQKPHDLAEAGLFYEGKRDLTICYFCGGGIHKWESKDIPLREHAQHYPDCGYVKMFRSNIDIFSNNSFYKMINSCLIYRPSFKIEKKKMIDFFGKCFKKDSHNNDISENLKNIHICNICREREANILFLPCGHLFVCKYCTTSLNNCPLCRFKIHEIVKVYFP